MPNVEELRQFYKQNKAYVDIIVQNAMKNNPELRQMREKNLFEQQMEEFRTAFPESELSKPEDFLAIEQADAFLGYIKKGLRIVEAYKLCCFDALLAQAQGKGKKAGLEQAQSKAHLKSTGSGSVKASGSIPAEVKDIYRVLLSDWDESKMLKHYNKR